MAAGTLTITTERQALVDFTDPTVGDITQIEPDIHGGVKNICAACSK